MKNISAILFLIMFIGITATAIDSKDKTPSRAVPGINNISCQQALDLIQEHEGDTNFVIVDFRPEKMYDEAHIERAIFHDVFLEDIDNWLNSLDKKKTYLIYCTMGHRSDIGLNKMKEMKFENIYHMNEGIIQWKKLGYKTVSDSTVH